MFRVNPRNVVTVCSNCLSRYGRQQKRTNFTVATAASSLKHLFGVPPVSGTSDAAKDDHLLKDFFTTKDSTTSTKSTGLFHNNDLSTPVGIENYAARTLRKAQRLVQRIENGGSKARGGLRATVRDLDRLSDLLCRVIDMADFVRSTHPDPRFVYSADKAFTATYEYMNILNTQSGLYDALNDAMNSYSGGDCTTEDLAVARILKTDFEKSGVNLHDEQKSKFVYLTNEIARLGNTFIDEPTYEKSYISVKAYELMGMDPMIVRQLKSGATVRITAGALARHGLRSVENENVRKELYLLNQNAAKSQIDLLEQLLVRRKQLATLVGFPDYASLALSDKMARNHAAVNTFLNAMAEANKPGALQELEGLKALKKQLGGTTAFMPWDTEYYTMKAIAAFEANSSRWINQSSPELSDYFSIGGVFQGLSRLFNSLYGVRLVPRPTGIGETWNSDVRRLDVISDTEGHIAVLYCDLFDRPKKSRNPAHFTIRCSRRINKDDVIDEDGFREDDGMASAVQPNGDVLQLPTIALICNFSRNSSKSGQCLLSFGDVQTLFHEMGHALHSILGRTELHNVAGTRCVTDFAELPSVLMESFAKSPEVLRLFARHHETGEPLPDGILERQIIKDNHCQAMETRWQIMLALLDQTYHVRGEHETKTTTDQFYEIEEKYGILPPVKGVAWQGFFSHLFGYGGTYYSYLFDRAIAARVWNALFKHNPTSREAGEKWKNDVLKWGGSKDPWHCIADVLGQEELREGGPVAMKEVGGWGAQLK